MTFAFVAFANSKKKFMNMLLIGTLVAIPLIMTMVSNPEYTDYFMYTIGPVTLLYLVYEMRNFFSIQENRS